MCLDDLGNSLLEGRIEIISSAEENGTFKASVLHLGDRRVGG
jgi:hypothetical protein